MLTLVYYSFKNRIHLTGKAIVIAKQTSNIGSCRTSNKEILKGISDSMEGHFLYSSVIRLI